MHDREAALILHVRKTAQRMCEKYFYLWLKIFSQALSGLFKRKSRAQNTHLVANVFLYANVYEVLWEELTLAPMPTPLPKVHFKHPALTASLLLPLATRAENSRIPLQWIYSFFRPHLPFHILTFILTLRSSSLWSVLGKYPHCFFPLSFHHIFQTTLHIAPDQVSTFTWENESIYFFR